MLPLVEEEVPGRRLDALPAELLDGGLELFPQVLAEAACIIDDPTYRGIPRVVIDPFLKCLRFAHRIVLSVRGIDASQVTERIVPANGGRHGCGRRYRSPEAFSLATTADGGI
jgi:hypothetical protein